MYTELRPEVRLVPGSHQVSGRAVLGGRDAGCQIVEMRPDGDKVRGAGEVALHPGGREGGRGWRGNLTILWVGELNCCGLTSCKKRFDRMGGGKGRGGAGGHCVV